MNPHKFQAQTKEDRDWATGIYNPNLCKICERSIKHPIHRDRYIHNHELYKTEHPNKQQ